MFMHQGELVLRIREAFDGMPAQLSSAARYVLDHARPVILERIGVAILRVIGQDQGAAWLMVTTVETDADDVYVVRGGRYLNDAEGLAVALALGIDPDTNPS